MISDPIMILAAITQAGELYDKVADWFNPDTPSTPPCYFQEEEFVCRCGCGLNLVKPALIQQLSVARHAAGVPFAVTSGTRCEAHNRKEGGKPTSAHLTGEAADVLVTSGQQRFAVVRGLVLAGFNRIGVAKSFVHADIATDKPQGVVWLY